jgi:hypothetical protein
LATKLGTFHWPPSFGSTFTSFSLKGELESLGVSLCLEDNFDAILNTYFTSFLKREIMFSFSGGKKEEK